MEILILSCLYAPVDMLVNYRVTYCWYYLKHTSQSHTYSRQLRDVPILVCLSGC